MPNEKFAALALDVDRASRCYLLHPATGQRITAPDGTDPAWVEVYSSDSVFAQDFRRVLFDRRVAEKNRVLSPDEQHAEGAEYLAAITANWNLRGLNGDKLNLTFDRGDALELYSWRGNAWLRDQVDRHAAMRGNYVPT